MMDKRTVRSTIEALFEQYRLFKFILETSSHKQQEPSYVEFIDRIESAVARLPERERMVIELRYLHPEGDYLHHRDVYRKMGVSAVTYSVIRELAFCRLRIALGFQGIPKIPGKEETNAQDAKGGC